jgi:hypothetical protein
MQAGEVLLQRLRQLLDSGQLDERREGAGSRLADIGLSRVFEPAEYLAAMDNGARGES